MKTIFDTHREDVILQNINKLSISPKNKFYWWRKYNHSHKPISKRDTIINKINIGYYDFSSYFWEAQLSLLELNKLYQNKPDYEIWLENSSRGRSRYKRLIEDFHKEENERLNNLYEDFTNNYKLNKEQVIQVIENFDGTIKELYNHFENNYKYKIFPSYKRSF